MWALLAFAILLLFVFFWPYNNSAPAPLSTDGVSAPCDSPVSAEVTVPDIPTVALIQRSRLRRVLKVSTVHGEFTVDYNGYGIGYESVLVDGKLAAEWRGVFRKMSHQYEFFIGPSKAMLSVVLPAWGELIPLCNFRLFSLELDGQCIYLESKSKKVTAIQ